MIAMPLGEVRARAESWARELGSGLVAPGQSTVGGGSLPGESIPTCVLALTVSSPDKFLASLRRAHPPVIARTENDTILLDPRTVLPGQDGDLLDALRNALKT
jgi:L-seryl-tRNA(Ser) seleniumtransferase